MATAESTCGTSRIRTGSSLLSSELLLSGVLDSISSLLRGCASGSIAVDNVTSMRKRDKEAGKSGQVLLFVPLTLRRNHCSILFFFLSCHLIKIKQKITREKNRENEREMATSRDYMVIFSPRSFFFLFLLFMFFLSLLTCHRSLTLEVLLFNLIPPLQLLAVSGTHRQPAIPTD